MQYKYFVRAELYSHDCSRTLARAIASRPVVPERSGNTSCRHVSASKSIAWSVWLWVQFLPAMRRWHRTAFQHVPLWKILPQRGLAEIITKGFSQRWHVSSSGESKAREAATRLGRRVDDPRRSTEAGVLLMEPPSSLPTGSSSEQAMKLLQRRPAKGQML